MDRNERIDLDEWVQKPKGETGAHQGGGKDAGELQSLKAKMRERERERVRTREHTQTVRLAAGRWVSMLMVNLGSEAGFATVVKYTFFMNL